MSSDEKESNSTSPSTTPTLERSPLLSPPRNGGAFSGDDTCTENLLADSLRRQLNLQDDDEGDYQQHQQQHHQPDSKIFRKELTSMNLPNMPSEEELVNNEPPTLRILVVADIDLASASRLAESALLNNGVASSDSDSNSTSNTTRPSSTTTSKNNPLHQVDLCIACGPFCKEDDLRLYYQGRQRRRHMIRQYNSGGGSGVNKQTPTNISGISDRYDAPTQLFLDSNLSAGGMNFHSRGDDAFPTPLPPPSQPVFHDHSQHDTHAQSSTSSGRHIRHNEGLNFNQNYSPPLTPMPHRQSNSSGLSFGAAPQQNDNTYPYKRSREETAALEGLVTAAISQLESIVCRVVVVPGGTTDPITISCGQKDGSLDGAAGDVSCDNTPNQNRERRLTPNSRNIHQRWMPISPGLGIAGLAYLEWQKLQQDAPSDENENDAEHFDYDDDSDLDLDEIIRDIQELADGGVDEEEDDRENSEEHVQNDDNFAGMPPLINGYAPIVSPGAESANGRHNNNSDDSQMEMERLKKEYGEEFCNQLQKLVQRAPPVSAISETPPSARTHPLIDNLLHTPLFQSILVSQFHHWQPPAGSVETIRNSNHSNHQNSESKDQVDEESFDPPWPSEHEAFCALKLIQEQVVLEIAAGLNSKGTTVHPMELSKGKMKVVLPGSLRERGEFCLVDVAFMKDTSSAASTSTATTTKPRTPRRAPSPVRSGKDNYRWMVRQTRFHCLNDFV